MTWPRGGKPTGRGPRIRDREECASARVALEAPVQPASPDASVSLNIGALASDRRNAFDLIRLLLAVAVVYSHAHLLGGFGVEGFSGVVQRAGHRGKPSP